MAAPSSGVTWVNSGLAEMVRDYAGSATDLSPRGTFGSPFALDGQVRNDLLITTPVSVSTTNCGFWLVGAIDPNGVSRKPKVTSDDLMILRSNSPIRSDIQEESKTVVFRCFQNKPLLDRLRRPGKSWDERPRTLFGTDAGHAVERSALRAEHAETASEQATVERDSERLDAGRRRRGRRPGRGRDATTLVGADRRRWSGR